MRDRTLNKPITINPMRPQVILTVISGEYKGKTIIFDESTSYTIGRAKNCNLCFEDNDLNSGISRYHCLLEIDPPHVFIRDLGSTNGTLVNGRLLGATDDDGDLSLQPSINQSNYKLDSGDEINVGDTILKLEISEVASETSTPVIDSPHSTDLDLGSSSPPKAKQLSLKSLAVKGTIWTIIGYGGTQVLRFGSNLILTRLLEPQIFGLMSLISIFLTSIQMFSDFGINQSIIRHKRGEDPLFLNTAWTVQVIRGISIWLIYLIIALPLSKLYNRPELIWLIPITGLNAILIGFNSTILATFGRNVAVSTITKIDIGIYLIQIAITLSLTLISRTIWPLIIGWLCSNLAKLALGHWLNRTSPNKFAWDKDALKELFSFGRWVFISTIIGFLANQSDVIILGKITTLTNVGVYNIAFTLSDIPRQIIAALSVKVIFPLVSKKLDLPRERFKTEFSRKRNFLLIPAAIAIAFMAAFGDLIVANLYDTRYEDARWMIPILSLGLWQTLLYRTMGSCLWALGKPFYSALGNFLRFVIVAIGLPIVFSAKGLLGAVILMSFSDLPLYLTISYGLWREKLNFILDDFKLSFFFVTCVIILFMTRMYLGLANPLAQFSI